MSFSQPALSKENRDTVDVPSALYDQMSVSGNWSLLHDLLGGTQAMRDAERKWLPQEEAEKHTHYKVRVSRSFLFAGYEETVERLSSKPFSRVVTVQGELPEQLSMLVTDVDKTGRNITQFAKEIFKSTLTYGVTHVLVDFPRMPTDASKADEEELGARPTFIHIEAPDLIGWRTDENGKLIQIRYFEKTVEADGNYKDKIVRRIRVMNVDSFEIWEEQKNGDKKEFVQIETGTHTFGSIPLATCYFNQKGFLTALPPLLKLAWVNLEHWQSASDYKNILRTIGIAILFGKGFSEEETKKGFTIGPRNSILTTNEDASLEYVEHTGNGLESFERHLKDLKDQMEFLGLQPLIQRSGDVTATASAIDEGKEQSLIQAWIRAVESFVSTCFQFAGEWTKVELPEDFKTDIFNEFGLSFKAREDIDALLKARQQGDISLSTFLKEIKRRGLLSEMLDVEEEMEAVDQEGPALGLIGIENKDDDDEPDTG